MNRRWYDSNKSFSKYIGLLKRMEQKERSRILNEVLFLINKTNPEIESKAILSINLLKESSRWYDDFDNYPKVYLLMNILPYADPDLLTAINSSLEDSLKEKV